MTLSAYLIPLDIIVLLLAFVYYAYILLISPIQALRPPPGPRQVPLLGNVHQIVLDNQTVTYTEWAQKYGDIVYARLFRRSFIILNSLQAARDLMAKRGSKYSDRPPFILIEDLYDFKPITVFLSAGEGWRRHRAWFQAAVETRSKLDGYRPLQRKEVDTLLMNLIQTPHAFISHIKRYTGAMMLEIAYGRNITTVEDEYIRLADTALTATLEGGLFSSLVEFFPVMSKISSWIPDGGFRMHCSEVSALVRQMIDVPFQGVQDALASGNAKPSFLSNLIEEMSKDGHLKAEDEFDIKGAASQMYNAGADTSSSTLTTFVLAMTLYPHVVAKAQAELDRVVGTERLVDFQDRDKLLYLECILKEVYRWHPPIPLGIAHQTRQRDKYRGYDIPEGSTVISNIWTMSRDASIYPDPEDFRPERYEDMDMQTAQLSDPRNMIFGFGRRICPGRHLADANIWLAMANILAVFDIGKSRDVAGLEITPSPSFTTGVVQHVHDFPCIIRPRTQMAADLVAQSALYSTA